MSKRFYQLKYKNTGENILFEDAGQLLKISGILLQGMGSNILVMLPAADKIEGEQRVGLSGEISYCHDIEIVQLSIDELSEFIRITDDPQIFEQDEYGNVKAIHRKVRSAISGAVQQKIWVRDGLICLYCGQRMGDISLTIDHWMPLELSGENNNENYISSCRSCNKRKGNMHPMDWCRQEELEFKEFQEYLKEYAPNPVGRYIFSHLQ